MIINQLNRIIFEILLAEKEFKLPPYCNSDELTATAVAHKEKKEDNIARDLYRVVKDYALSTQEKFNGQV